MSQPSPSSVATADHDPLLSERFLGNPCLPSRTVLGHSCPPCNLEHTDGTLLPLPSFCGQTRLCRNDFAVVAVVCHS